MKTLHVACAYATGAGFFLRGVLALRESPLLQHRVVKTAPHVIDSLLLGSALLMLLHWRLSPFAQPWLAAKILVLLVYIAFGFAMLRWGSTPTRRWIGFFGGLLSYAYIVSVAHGKSPWPWLQSLST